MDKPNYELRDQTFRFVVKDKVGGTPLRSDPVSILPVFPDTGGPRDRPTGSGDLTSRTDLGLCCNVMCGQSS